MFQAINIQEKAEAFKESGMRLLPEGWHKTRLINCVKENFGFGECLVINFENETNVMINFNGDEQWKRDNALATIGKIVDACGITGTFTPDRLPELHGRELDIKNQHKQSKKVASSGKPYINNKLVNFAKAGTQSSLVQPNPSNPSTQAAAGGWGAPAGTGSNDDDVPF